MVCLLGLGACSNADDSDARNDPVATDAGPTTDVIRATGAGDSRVSASAELFGGLDVDGPGCSAAIRHLDGVHDVQVGLADVSGDAPITPDTIFDIGSVSKQMTAGVVAAQIIDGDLDLDEPITTYFDGLPPGSSAVTIEDLVHHTSGLPDYTELLDAELDEVTDAGDAIDAVRAADGLNFEPGTDFDYSNTNYVLLAELSALAGQADFVELSGQYIFEPLAMASTTVRDDQGDLLDGQATGYEQIGPDEFEIVSSSWRQTGDGAVHSTPRDVLRWAEVFITPTTDDAIVGSQEWVDSMLQPGSVSDDGTDYAFGVSVGNGLISHSGSWIGYSSYLAIRPDAGTAVAISCNIDEFDADSLGNALLDIWS